MPDGFQSRRPGISGLLIQSSRSISWSKIAVSQRHHRETAPIERPFPRALPMIGLRLLHARNRLRARPRQI